MVRFSSYCSASARIKLLEGIKETGFDNVYYMDTDSIITSNLLPENCIFIYNNSYTLINTWIMEIRK